MLLLACLFVGISLVTAQTQKITGVVISEEDGQPVVGASVLVKGTTQGTITDVDGNFNLANVPSSAKTLQISYIGMQAQEVAIKPHLKDWSIDRLLKSDRIILRMATFEILHSDTPKKVVVNEAVELTKQFSDDDHYKFVNGVLSNIND